MEFLVIVVALALHKLIPDLRLLHQDNWYHQWLQRLGGESLSLPRYVVSLALPVLAALAITVAIDRLWGPVALFLFYSLGLLYSLGRGDLPAQLHALEEDVETRRPAGRLPRYRAV